MSCRKFRAAFTRLLLAAPALPLIACNGEEPYFHTQIVYSQTLPDGGGVSPAGGHL